MKNILLLTPIYPAADLPKTDTKVVHYFAKEWVKMGYNVFVFHYVAIFPAVFYVGAKLVERLISSKVGFGIRTSSPQESTYVIDGVKVFRFQVRKYWPHKQHPQLEIDKAVSRTVNKCKEQNFMPDVIVGHFANPSLIIMTKLKAIYNRPICYVAHSAKEINVYGVESEKLYDDIDLIGFRSEYIKKQFYRIYKNKPSFICHSGIPAKYIDTEIKKDLRHINNFIYVGTLIKRKYPDSIVYALNNAYGEKDYRINYIGSGNESKAVVKAAKKCNSTDKVFCLGRLSRDNVVEIMDTCQVFVMISKYETFGLVYLEAMSRGLITIASRNEGFDGIIIDGVNGFLCEAGDINELTTILKKLQKLPLEERIRISNNAIKTASILTDRNTAFTYIRQVHNIVDTFNKKV